MVCGRSVSESPFYHEQHQAFRGSLRRFVEREIAPHVDRWDEAEAFPRELYNKAAEVGLLGLGFPEEYGGTPADPFYVIVACEELARAGSGGINAGLMSSDTPPMPSPPVRTAVVK